jgi:predicted nicotinamide N-methyase
MFSLSSLVALVATAAVASAHTVITYPGWRGNNIQTNGTEANGDVIPGSLGITFENGTVGFPYGMQWMYPCKHHQQLPSSLSLPFTSTDSDTDTF